MSVQDKLGFFKWVTNISLVVLISFSYFYFGPINGLEQKINDLNTEIQIDNVEIDNTTANNLKLRLIKSNLAKAENLDRLSKNLMIYRGVAVIFILLGLFGSVTGLRHIKNHHFPPAEKPAKEEKESAETV